MYIFDSRVRYSETNEQEILSLGSIVNYFQDASTFQSEDLGVGVTFCKERSLVWVMSAWQIVIHEYPSLGDRIRIGTFPYSFKGFLGQRNFFLESDSGQRLVEANSLWTLLNVQSGMPVRVPEELIEKYVLSEPLKMDYAPRKIAIPDGGVNEEPFFVCRQHLDGNHHVNNGQYINMAMEYLPSDFTIGQMRAEYKKQARLHDRIAPKVVLEEGRVTVSLNADDGKSFAVVEFTKK